MTRNYQRLSIWTGPAFMLVFLVGLALVAGLVPPPHPGWTAAQIAEFYQDNHLRILIGLAICLVGIALSYPWVAAISVLLKRIEGSASPMTYTQFLAGSTTGMAIGIASILMGVAAYRADRSPDLVLMLNDVAWLTIIGVAGPVIAQYFSIAVVILGDKSAQPLAPRWVGYFNVWAGLMLPAAALVLLFKSGPFAWNGLISFYVELTIFAAFVGVMTWTVLKAEGRQTQEAGQAVSNADTA